MYVHAMIYFLFVTSVPRKWYGGTKINRTLPMLAPQAPIPTKKHWPFSPAEEGFTRFTTRLDCLPQMATKASIIY